MGSSGGKRICSGASGAAARVTRSRDADAHVLEVPAAPIHAGHARLDQQSALDQLGEKRRLLRAARAKAGH